jgi:HlyD family secretion protein
MVVKRVVLAVVILVAAGLVGYLAVERARSGPPEGTLYGNVEVREVNLAFNAEGTVADMPRREGDKVRKGDLLATLDDGTYRTGHELAVARRDQAKAQLDLLLAGTRPERIDQARAAVANAEAVAANAETTYTRQADLVGRNAVSKQDYDNALRERDAARARLAQAKAALAEAIAGPRPEEIAAARAALKAAEATVALSQVQLDHTRLFAPADGTITTRVVEPGTVLLPTSPVYAMAIAGEVWVRGFAPEPLLGRIAQGTEVTLTSDGGGQWKGRIGYVSPVAEFTPKTVETPELRTQLVYRFRVRVENPDDRLRQGMPVTITLPPAKG